MVIEESAEPTLVRVTLVLCGDCLAGVGGECHTPGCALWMNRAPDVPIADNCESFVRSTRGRLVADPRTTAREAKANAIRVEMRKGQSFVTPGGLRFWPLLDLFNALVEEYDAALAAPVVARPETRQGDA